MHKVISPVWWASILIHGKATPARSMISGCLTSKANHHILNPVLNSNGRWFTHLGYITDILGTYSLQFVKEALGQNKPWILVYTPIAPHASAEPFVGDQNLYTDLEPYRPPSFNEADVSDKPSWLEKKPLMDEKEIAAIDKFRRDQILSLVSLDRAVGALMDSLEAEGELENTFVLVYFG